MKHIYNKLIRDRIPEIIENDHKTCATRILNDEEYLKCLKSKLLEECNEVIDAEGEDIKKEIADVLEVLEVFEVYNINLIILFIIKATASISIN